MAQPETDETGGRGVQAIETGGRLLSAMVAAGAPAMLRDLAKAAGMTPAQAHAYFRSFRSIGLVEQDASTGRYGLGPFALQLGMARLRSFDPLRMAGHAAANLSVETGLMVAVLVWGTFGPTVVQVQEGADQLHVNVRAGNVFTLSGTASGTVFAAFMQTKAVRELLKRERAEGARTQRIGAPIPEAELEANIIRARSAGYVTIDSRPVPGVNAISAPVFDSSGQMQLALTLIGPAAVLPVDANSPFIAQLLDVTRQLSMQLGWAEPPLKHAGGR
jgi:DNA-binding IclR family transcriptional regulator